MRHFRFAACTLCCWTYAAPACNDRLISHQLPPSHMQTCVKQQACCSRCSCPCLQKENDLTSKRLGVSHSALFGHVHSSMHINKGKQHHYMRFYAAMVLTDIVREVSAVQQHAAAFWLNNVVR